MRVGSVLPMKWYYTMDGVFVESSMADPRIDVSLQRDCRDGGNQGDLIFSEEFSSGSGDWQGVSNWHYNLDTNRPVFTKGCYYDIKVTSQYTGTNRWTVQPSVEIINFSRMSNSGAAPAAPIFFCFRAPSLADVQARRRPRRQPCSVCGAAVPAAPRLFQPDICQTPSWGSTRGPLSSRCRRYARTTKILCRRAAALLNANQEMRVSRRDVPRRPPPVRQPDRRRRAGRGTGGRGRRRPSCCPAPRGSGRASRGPAGSSAGWRCRPGRRR